MVANDITMRVGKDFRRWRWNVDEVLMKDRGVGRGSDPGYVAVEAKVLSLAVLPACPDEGMGGSVAWFFLFNHVPGDVAPVGVPGNKQAPFQAGAAMSPGLAICPEQPEVTGSVGGKNYLKATLYVGLSDGKGIPESRQGLTPPALTL